MMKRVSIILSVVLSAVLLTGCHGDSSSAMNLAPTESLDITMSDDALDYTGEEPVIYDDSAASVDSSSSVGLSQQAENGSYIELNISLDDLKFAGYSVKDGNHMSEVCQAVAEELQSFPGQIPNGTRYDGWAYVPELRWPGTLYVYYFIEGNSAGTATYKVEDRAGIDNSLPTIISIGYGSDDSRVPVDEYPLLGYSVLPGTSYEETIDYFQLEPLIQSAKGEAGWIGRAWYKFDSQYGKTTFEIIKLKEVDINNEDVVQISIYSDEMSVYLKFKDGLLDWIDYSAYVDTEPFDYFNFNMPRE